MSRKKNNKSKEGEADSIPVEKVIVSTENETIKIEEELITVSNKPNFTPKKVELKEEEKNINPPPMKEEKLYGLTETWGPANKKRRR